MGNMVLSLGADFLNLGSQSYQLCRETSCQGGKREKWGKVGEEPVPILLNLLEKGAGVG